MGHARLQGERTLMRIHIGENDKGQGKVLYKAIVEVLHDEKFSGATVIRAVAGSGPTGHYHGGHVFAHRHDLPVVIEVVEDSDRIDRILPKLDDMVGRGVITLEKVSVILYRPEQKSA